jgi:hypothetical protein
MPDVGLGRVILPFKVSANTAVRKFPISSSVVIPFSASFAERVPFGITTPSKRTSAALFFLVPANAIPFQMEDENNNTLTRGDPFIIKNSGSATGARTRTLSLERAAC